MMHRLGGAICNTTPIMMQALIAQVVKFAMEICHTPAILVQHPTRHNRNQSDLLTH
jgi:hypothetical protein